jgi:hypothetical protein
MLVYQRVTAERLSSADVELGQSMGKSEKQSSTTKISLQFFQQFGGLVE